MTSITFQTLRNAALCTAASIAWHTVSARQAAPDDGNIVAIFGQQKVETTDEGRVFHRFREGLLLPGGMGAGTLYNGQDMVAWLYATGRFTTPQAGDSLGYTYPNQKEAPMAYQSHAERQAAARGHKPRWTKLPDWIWSPITADSSGIFRSPQMRSAYLYTAYTAPQSEIALLETTGGTRTYINGEPHEGDHYDFGYTLIPVRLKEGLNEIIYTPGRFGRVESKLVAPKKPILFTKRDMTLPDLIAGENGPKWAAIRVVNATEKPLTGLTIRATLSAPDGRKVGDTVECKTDDIMPLAVRKVKFQLPATGKNSLNGPLEARLELIRDGEVLDTATIQLRQVSPAIHHERTFVSRIDGSVQYYSVAPALRTEPGDTGAKAFILTVHGASVEARNQARAYKQKDWVDIVAPTNRRPYGFNWEEWGRIDALEVLEEAQRIFKTDTTRIYLTGHSMGGHGTWFLGTTYPSKFAAIAPCAGYPDIAGYGSGKGDAMHRRHPLFEPFVRGAAAGRVVALARNLKQSGVYIHHGSADNVVPTSQAHIMREALGRFHTDFCYHEYPGGEHWFGDASVDWPPIFDFFARHSIPAASDVDEIDFYTASPAVSSQDYWLTVEQQESPYRYTNVQVRREGDTVIRVAAAENTVLLTFDLPALKMKAPETTIVFGSGERLTVPTAQKAIVAYRDGKWKVSDKVDPKQKHSGRYGGFKQAFDNRMVFVYSTVGTAEETAWWRAKARFDAETFYYRGNGSVDIIPDLEYEVAKYPNRNVILYGNYDNNYVWSRLLKDCPIQVRNGEVSMGTRTFTGNDIGAYFVYPHPDYPDALVGVVTATGTEGMRATGPNNYISGITGFPDLIIFRADMLKDGLDAVETAGFFDNDWSLHRKDFVTR
ncbi:prolyl oligopeptidase family serine peptidase [uncultured Rikenella sp.]|uniref:carboxylesterase family protein n=1 Tax=uncultured Rikenella sp. TaxID=368003 RepID=UPI00262F1C47|nr:prolyl oligopeptidase family serine peptidase [uncultured Rikenella sp.]